MTEQTPTALGVMRLETGTLWKRTIEQTDRALACGALHTIPTDYELVEQAGIRFLVREISNLARKDAAKKTPHKTPGKDFNPFLPYDENMFVADISDTHVCLLNKFNVVEHHLLIVTRAFEEQESLLTLSDFQAMWIALAEIDGLAFYNSGKTAGASQRHKHLQLVPLPLVPNGEAIPIRSMLANAVFEGMVGTIPSFPFVHAFVKLNPDGVRSPEEAGKTTLECYRTLMQTVGLWDEKSDRPLGPYNFLATREWMLIVPRSQENFAGIEVNSLGFAGALLVRNEDQMKIMKDNGPLNVLKTVGKSL